MNKICILIIFIFILGYIYSCFYCQLSYAEFVKDDTPDEPKIFERNDHTIEIITSESEIEI